MKYRIIFLLFILLHNCNYSFSQEEDPSLYTIFTFGTDIGLPQNQVLDIIYTPKGLLISTFNGTVIFNGNEFLPLTSNPNNKTIGYHRLFYDKSTDYSYGWSSHGSFRVIDPIDSLIGTYSAVDQRGDTIIKIQIDGLIRETNYDGSIVYNQLKSGILKPLSIVKTDSYYYVSDANNLYEIDSKSGSKKVIIPHRFDFLKLNPLTNEVFAINGDLYKIKEGVGVVSKTPLVDSPTTTIVFRDVVFLEKDHFIITSSNGIFHVYKDQVNNYYERNSYIPSSSLYRTYNYSNGQHVYVGTENIGLMLMTQKIARTYHDKNQEGSQSFTSVVKDKQGNVYSAVNGKILKITPTGETDLFIDLDGFHIFSLTLIDNLLYVGSWGDGLLLYKDNNLLRRESFLDGYSVSGVLKSSSGDLWYTHNGGITIKKKDGEIVYYSDKIPELIYTIKELENGTICLGGEKTIYFLSQEGQLIKKITSEDGLKGRAIRSFYEDKQQRLWIGTYGGGLYVYEDDKLTSINDLNYCQLSLDVFSLEEFDGIIYMSSNMGLYAVPMNILEDFYKKKRPYLVPKYYGKEAGLLNTEFNGGFLNNSLVVDSILYLPSVGGLVSINLTDSRNYYKEEVKPFITHVWVNDTLLPPNSSTVFSKNTHTIRFDFYSPSYKEIGNLYYQYIILKDGKDGKWSELQKENYASLKMLPPGKYVFKVRGIDSQNLISPEEISFEFTILPNFYKTPMFFFIITALILSLITFIFYNRSKKKLEQKELKNSLLEMQIKSIDAQLNPHFMFNSINTIVYLLEIKEYDKAEELLIDFTSLLRKYLDKRDSFITIEEEFTILELYLSIQQKRHENFDYDISFTQNIGGLMIPSFILQPIVENAIIHGIAHSDKRGYISIVAFQYFDRIVLKVEDNGIGRKKSEKINRKRTNHISKGTELIQNKIKILQEKHKVEVLFNYLDIEKEEETGTIVTIQIILNKNRT